MRTVSYVTPQAEVVEFEAEGVLCGSVDIEIGNGGNAFDEE